MLRLRALSGLPRLLSGASCLGAASVLRLGPGRPYSVKRRSYWQALQRWLRGPPTPPFRRPCLVGAPVLRAVAAAVPPEQVRGPEVQRLVAALVAALRRADAVGLSAPQLGVPLRVLAVEVPERIVQAQAPRLRLARDMTAVPLRVLINPRLRVLDSRTVVLPEACHSVPGFSACVARHRAVEVTACYQGWMSVGSRSAGKPQDGWRGSCSMRWTI
ncbi:peptide deformylase, mitochondrial isoform X2 [Pristis pectinata]|uniref:peptide deformylase, mitochondrial isoform X2 n=1 Tax=Pristis pectinata TaxID=685728 RepID=UPI00223D58EA|nr:peptide deformylase, mitochondrial isoform X2 [Pristis pectinata]